MMKSGQDGRIASASAALVGIAVGGHSYTKFERRFFQIKKKNFFEGIFAKTFSY